MAAVGKVAYTLALPPDSKIHLTFHISQLKKKIGSRPTSATLPIVHSSSGHVLLVPEAILDRRMVQKNGRVVSQWLIKWFNAPEEDNTWEDHHTFCQQFLLFHP